VQVNCAFQRLFGQILELPARASTAAAVKALPGLAPKTALAMSLSSVFVVANALRLRAASRATRAGTSQVESGTNVSSHEEMSA
jgi:hypothetical protein